MLVFISICICVFFAYLIFLCVFDMAITNQSYRNELDIDSEEINMYIDGKWYSESEIVSMVHKMQDKIKELEKENEFLIKHIEESKDESEGYD